MQQQNKPASRKKFLWWGAAAFAAVAAFRFIPGLKKDKKETVKMLGQDGRLVEIDKKLLTSSVKKVSNDELQQWIKK
jgi:hypothetical protein